MAIYIETRERTKTPDAFEGYETPKTLRENPDIAGQLT